MKERRKINFAKVNSVFRRLRAGCDVLLIEGMGGVLVPITRGFLMADLIRRWKIPVILVARWGLGTLNHTLLSLEALRSRRIRVAGLIFNQTVPGKIGFVERSNIQYFRRQGFPPVLATVRYAKSDSKRCLSWEPGVRLWEGLNRLS